MKHIRELHISFSPDSVITITKTDIPLFVKFVASFGVGFSYILRPHDGTLRTIFEDSIYAVVNSCDQLDRLLNARRDFDSMFSNIEMENSAYKFTKAQLFIRQQAEKSQLFLRDNPEVVITPADKGGKTIILDRGIYNKKVDEHIKENLSDHTYFHWKNANIDDCRRVLEPKYERIRALLNPYLKKDVYDGRPNTCHQLKFEPYIVPRLYIKIKAHKDGMPPRPVISATNGWCKEVSKWIIKKLELIGSRFDGIKVRSSSEVFDKVGGQKLKSPDHRLMTWDYVSMFPNIQFVYPKRVILENYDAISETTCVPVDLFVMLVSFLVEDSSYFAFEHRIYRQTKALTMGNSLSQILAEIATNNAVYKTLQSMNQMDISFMYKFVDDFAAAMNVNTAMIFEERLTSVIKGLKIKRVVESPDGTISFLDSLLIRNADQTIVMKWWQKPCSARKIINFHSNHPTLMKRNVIREFMCHAFKTTSPSLYQDTIKIIRVTLRRSSYPPNFIRKSLNEVLSKIGRIHIVSTVGSPDEDIDLETEISKENNQSDGVTNGVVRTKKQRLHNLESPYIAFPFNNIRTYKASREIVRANHADCLLAPSTIRSNRSKIFARLKDEVPLTCIKFAVFTIGCKNCSFSEVLKTESLDVQRTIGHFFNRHDSPVAEHLSRFHTHFISKTPRRLITLRNKFDVDSVYDRLSRL